MALVGVKLLLGGKRFRRAFGYSVVEDASPVDPSDTSGGTGQTTVSMAENNETFFLLNKSLDLRDDALGTTRGIVKSLASTDGKATVTADGRLALLAAERTAQPFTGTLGDALRYYFGLVGIKAEAKNRILIDKSLEDIYVALPGWQGEVWLKVNKQLAPAYGFEVSLVSGNVVVRKTRQRTAVTFRDISTARSLDSSEAAQAVEIFYYNNVFRTDALAYPVGGWNPDVEVFQADANELVTYEVELSASLTAVQQPIAVDSVGRTYNSSSVYAVAGGDGLPITAAQWEARGGSLKVAIIEDTKTLRITIRGARDAIYAPYRIAMSAGPSDWYSSLRIVGTGVFQEEESVILPTGANPDRVSTEEAPSVKNEFISTLTNAYDRGVWASARWAGPKQSISASSGGIQHGGENSSYAYPTIADFNAAQLVGGSFRLISAFNTEYAGRTVASFNEEWTALARAEFANQAFGNVIGARVKKHLHWWRIRSTTITESSVQYTAERDTTVGDFNAVWTKGTPTIADFNTLWAYHSLSDFTIAPLRR